MELIRDSNKKWRRARWGVALMFFTNGAVIAGLLPRYPELKDALGLSNAGFGALVAAVAVGSLVASGLPAVAIRRFGARRTATVGTVLMAAVMALVGISPAVWAVALLLGAVGLLDAVVDAAQNVHGLFVQEGLGKTVINSMHASWSIGAALGGLGAALAQGAGVGLGIHLGVSGLLVAAVAVLAYFAAAAPSVSMGAGGVSADADGAMRGGAEPESGGPPGPSGAEGVEGAGMRSAGPGATASARPRPGLRGWAFLMLLALMAVAGALIEDVGNNWSANFLRDSVGLPLAFVGYGYVTLLVFQFLGRILGDPLTDRFGRDGRGTDRPRLRPGDPPARGVERLRRVRAGRLRVRDADPGRLRRGEPGAWLQGRHGHHGGRLGHADRLPLHLPGDRPDRRRRQPAPRVRDPAGLRLRGRGDRRGAAGARPAGLARRLSEVPGGGWMPRVGVAS
jgi:hypothetical protein